MFLHHLKRTNLFKSKRAAFFKTAALFFIIGCLAPPLFAQTLKSSEEKTAPKRTENYTDTIIKAQNLMLQNDRQQAINVLVAALKREHRKKSSYIELKKTLFELSRAFILEKTQQQFESAVTLKGQDEVDVINKLNEALKLEPNNYLILFEINKRLIEKKECNSVIKNLKEINISNPFDEGTATLLAYAYLCTNEIDNYFAMKSKMEFNILPQSLFAHLEAIRLIIEKNPVKLKETIDLLLKTDKENPEIEYYKFKQQQLTKNKTNLDKYNELCKSIKARKEREFGVLPNFCKHSE